MRSEAGRAARGTQAISSGEPASPGLNTTELRLHDERGYTIVRQLFDETAVQEMLAEAARLWQRADLIDPLNLRCRFQKHLDTGKQVFECFDPYFDLSPVLAEYSRHPRLAAVMHSIYGEPGHVCHNQLIFKPPRTEGYSLHQDYVSWPIFPRSFHTVAIALDATDEGNGCIELYPGGHTKGLLTPENGEFHQLTDGHVAHLEPLAVSLSPGDAVIFNCLIPHRSAANQSSDRFRRTLFYCFNADSDGGDFREKYYDYYHEWSAERRAAHGQTGLSFR